jgi:hypothetical protein
VDSSTLAGNTLQELIMVYKPTSVGSNSGSIKVITDLGSFTIAMSGSAEKSTLPQIQAVSSIDFGTIEVSSADEQSSYDLTISNAGMSTLSLGVFTITGTDAKDFSISTDGKNTIYSGSSMKYTLYFTAPHVGTFNAMLNVLSNAVGGTVQIPVTVTVKVGSVVAYRINCGNDDAAVYTDSDGNVWNGDKSLRNALGTAVPGDGTLAASNTWFKPSTGAYVPAYTLSVASAGTYDVSLYFSETYYKLAQKRLFDIYMNGVKVTSSLDVYAEQQKIGGRMLILNFSVDVSGSSLEIGLGHILDNPFVSGFVVSNGASLFVSPASTLDFGNVEIGTVGKKTVRIVNFGSSTSVVSQITVSSSVFSIVSTSVALPATLSSAGESLDVVVQAVPDIADAITGTLSIEGTNMISSTVGLTMNVFGTNTGEVLSSDVRTLDFSEVLISSPYTQMITITNKAASAVTISEISVAAPFSAYASGNLPLDVASLGTFNVYITLSPVSEDSVSSVVSIKTADSTYSIKVTGKGKYLRTSMLRINAGASTSFVNASTYEWAIDASFVGGTALVNSVDVTANGITLSNTERYWNVGTEGMYSIPVSAGKYEVMLYFYETYLRLK